MTGGATVAIASLWPVDDPIAALTSMVVPAWWFQSRLAPDVALTTLQRELRTGTWKRLLLREEQLKVLPNSVAENIGGAQEYLWNLPDEEFESESSWACFRCHGR